MKICALPFIYFLFLISAPLRAQVVPFDSLTKVLEEILVLDQEHRKSWQSIMQQYGATSPEFTALLSDASKQDSSNMRVVGVIIDKYGWLSPAQTSKEANDALFLVIQHAPLQEQLKYLPVMREAVARKKANAKDLALLIDRTNMYQGKLQIYGSQLTFDAGGNVHIYPIEKEPGVEARRKAIGLMPMNEYVKYIKDDMIYVQAKKNLYKDKIIIKGSVTNAKDNKAIDGVSVYIDDSLLVGRTDKSGFFEIITKQKYRGENVVFKKEGFAPISIMLEVNQKVVYDLNPALSEK